MSLSSLVERARGADTFEGPITGIPYAEFLGLWARRDGDTIVAWLKFSDHLIGNPVLPALHGGVTGALLEMAGMLQVCWETGKLGETVEQLPKPIGITVEYLRTGRPGDVFAAADIARAGRRIANVRAEAWQTDRAKPIAAGLMHFLMPSA